MTRASTKPCAIEAHPLIEQMDAKLREKVAPRDVWKWINEETPDDQVSLAPLELHARSHLGVKPRNARTLYAERHEAAKPPSEKLGRDITDDDIEQRLKRRFYDAIDSIPPEKIAELMIEREKAKGRVAALPKPAAAKTPTEDEVPPDVQEMRDAAAAALGPRRGRTGLRAVRA